MNRRVDSLNFIRILGMTMILLFHARLMYGFSIGLPWLDQLISIGAVFITTFFMLSGFGLRKSNRELSLRDFSGILNFYKKRILSIYPLFLLLSVVALFFQFRVADSLDKTLALLPIQFSMLHILFGKDMHWFLFNDNCWYISALFVLYLLFPILNAFVNWISNRFRVLVKISLCFVLWIVSVSVYFYLIYCTEYVFLDYYPNPFFRIPEFLIGMICVDLSEDMNIRDWFDNWKCSVIAFFIGVITTVCLLLLKPYFVFETPLYDMVIIPCTAIIFLCFANWKWLNQVGSTKSIRWLAGLGLEVYLCQSLATLTLEYMDAGNGWDEYVFIILSVLFAVGVNTWFTKPIKKMAKK